MLALSRKIALSVLIIYSDSRRLVASVDCRRSHAGRGTAIPRIRRRGLALGVRLSRDGLAGIALLATLAGRSAHGQSVSGIDDETVTLPGGVIRFSASESDTRYDSRYGTGGLQPLGAGLSVDSLNASQLPILAPLQTSLRALTQNAGLTITLGETQVTSSVRVSVTPLGLDIGIAHWLMLRATVPIVRTRTEILFNPNRGGNTGNVGLNPALGIPGALAIDTAIFGKFEPLSFRTSSARLCKHRFSRK